VVLRPTLLKYNNSTPEQTSLEVISTRTLLK
jgi:hypothetical protein